MEIHNGLNTLPRFKNAVVTIGSFDGVHKGHLSIIKRITELARQNMGESVMLTFDPHPRQIIYPQDQDLKLLTTLNEKISLLKSSGLDHLVIIPFTFEFSRMGAEEYLQKVLIDKFHPSVLVIGYDHKFGLNRSGDVALLRQLETKYDFHVEEIKKETVDEIVVSSTKVRDALQHKEIIKANHLLGHNYRLNGRVIRGLKIGKTLGYPTANIEISDPNKLIPPEGIYAVKLRLDGRWNKGMMYIGRRPTLEAENELSIEINIFDYSNDIYGESIEIELLAYIRDDQKFADLSLLKKQISDDERIVRRLFNRLDEDDRSILKCAVVILNYNGVDHLRHYLPGVLDKMSDDVKTFVADNGSTDNSLEWLGSHYPNVEVIRLKKNYGFAGGYNEALKHVRAKYFILLNSDVEPGENFPGALIEELDKNGQIAACQPKVLSVNDRNRFEYAGACGGFMDSLGYPFCRGRILESTEVDRGQYQEKREIFWATGAAMAIRSNLFKKIGGFDSSYFAHQEEIDLCWRLKRAGFKITVVPDSTVYHLGGGTLDYLSERKTFLNFKNSLSNILKNVPLLKAMAMLFLRLILDGVAAFYFLSKGQARHLMAVAKAHFHFYASIPRLLKTKYRYNQLISYVRYGQPRTHIGRYRGSIVWQYYLQGRKAFESLKTK
jgi:riboflavin kinase/FMN adenylyltransferase